MNMEPITLPESKRLIELEHQIEDGQQAWLEVGLALTEIRDNRLYRAEFETFADYCQQTWKWTDKRAYQLISAADETSTTGRTFPTERAARVARKERQASERQPAPDTDEETPHITQPTLDAQWKAATGNAKAPVELPAHIQELIDELKLCRDNCDCFVECVTSGDCEPDSVKDCAKHLKKLSTLMMAYAVEIAP